MSFFLLLKLVTVGAALFMATFIIARDPGFRVNRLMGALMIGPAWWGFCDVLWNTATDPGAALWLMRLSVPGWLMLGAIFFDIFIELAGTHHSGLARWRRFFYGSAIVLVGFYVFTPWFIARAVETPWGFGFDFGPLLPVPVLFSAGPVAIALLNWQTLYPRQGSGGERHVSRTVFTSIGLALLFSMTTDAALPYFGVQVPNMGSTAITLAGLVIATRLHRYGYSLLSAGAFSQEILETLHDGVLFFQRDGRVRACNSAFARLAGCGEDEVVGKPIGDLLPGFAERAMELDGVSEGALVQCGGAVTPVLVSQPLHCRVRERAVGAAVVVRDMREVVNLRDSLVMSTRLAAVGDLSVGIAQEIARPIGAVCAELDGLRTEWQGLIESAERAGLPGEVKEQLHEGREIIVECVEGVARISGIAKDVGGFAGASGEGWVPTRLDDVVEGAVRMFQPRARRGIDLVVERDRSSRVLGDRQELEQVVLNLLINALHATGDEGTIHVATGYRDGVALITVQDDGCGIEPAVLDRIFDPFFTTKAVGEGTGLGLAISYHIVHNHGGEIHVTSRPGRGASFRVELPALVAD